MDVHTLYDNIIANCDGFEKKGKNMLYTSANGYMFSLINKEGELGIRLSKESGQQFMQDHNSGPFKSHGATMKDYVIIPKDLWGDEELLSETLKESFKHVMSLPPK